MPVFDAAVGRFFAELARHNDRVWFQAHREDYERLVRTPLERVAIEAGERYGPTHVTRAHRDVRFSPDKSPYSLSASMRAGEVGGVYLEVDATGVSVGGGLYGPSRDQLQRAREAIDGDERAADALQRALDRLEHAGFEVAGPALKTAPRGYPRDHPRIELLRLQHYAALRRLPLDAEHRAVRDAWRAVEPLSAWASERVGTARSWP